MAKLLCGVDLGGTKLSVGLVDEQGTVRDRLVVHDHVRKSEAELILLIRDMIRSLLDRHALDQKELAGIGVGFAGHLRYREGVVITTSNFPAFKLKDFPIRQAIQDHFSIPVLVDNDANAQGWAEFLFGAGRPYDTMIFLTISTGIGAGLVLDRHIYRGVTGTAGEFGHTIVNPLSDIRCGCGNYGCLMSHASGLALPQLVRKKLEAGVPSKLHLEAEPEITGELVGRGLEAGDEVCRAVVLECADYIGIGVYNLFQIFNPPVIVLGGGLVNWGELYLQRVKDKFRALAREMLFDPMEIAVAKTGQDAGLIGAAALLLEEP
ncbi:MAG: ROK family protein [Spirochaetales bacterium]|nr:ROK family protein [Spirochaetales bacterium]